MLSKRPRWKIRLEKELAHRAEFADLDEANWRALLESRRVTSTNHDTVLSLDWPHYCVGATKACGGHGGWCYTFQGNQASVAHNRHAALVDTLARRFPELFGERVAQEVLKATSDGLIPYPNLRYSGSGEVVLEYIAALKCVIDHGVKLWGFTRDLEIARALRKIQASVLVSIDSTSTQGLAGAAVGEGFGLAYSSTGVLDVPPRDGTVVTFPVHRIGRVREVVDVSTVCPKVLADFHAEARPSGYCQTACHRCHNPSTAS